MQEHVTERRVTRFDHGALAIDESELRPLRAVPPAPRIAEPELWQHVQRRSLGPAVVYGHVQQYVAGVRLRVLDEHVEIAAVVEAAGVDELVLGLADSA